MIGDPLQELAASWAPFASGLAWAAWCAEDRLSEIAEQLELVHAEQLDAAVFEAQHEADPPAEVIPIRAGKVRGRRHDAPVLQQTETWARDAYVHGSGPTR